jgi:hypothetical protein
MDILSLDTLADPAELRAFVDATSAIAKCSERAVLDAMVIVLERNLRRASDDLDEVHRLGRVLRTVGAELGRTPSDGLRPRADANEGRRRSA